MDLEQKRVDCIVEKHGRSRATLQHTRKKIDQILCGPIVCDTIMSKNSFGTMVICFEKVDEMN